MNNIQRAMLINQMTILNGLQMLMDNNRDIPRDITANFVHNAAEAIEISDKLLKMNKVYKC